MLDPAQQCTSVAPAAQPATAAATAPAESARSQPPSAQSTDQAHAPQPSPLPSGRPEPTGMSVLLRGPRAVPTVAVVGLFLLGCVAFLYLARPFFLPVILALMLHFLLKPVVRALARVHIVEPLGAALVLAGLLWAFVHGLAQLSEPARQWAGKAATTLSHLTERLDQLVRWTRSKTPAEPSPPPAASPPQVHIQTSLAQSALSFTTGFLGGTLETVVLLYFFLASGDLFIRKLARVLPTSRDQAEAQAIIQEVQQNVSRFLFTITLINLGVAGVVAGILSLVQLPNPLLWGALAGLLNFIPYFGPFTMVVVLTLVGLTSYEAVGQGLLPPVLYLGVHALESNFITPMILGRRLALNPVVIFISLIFWTWLWGVPGALLAVPLLMTLKIICDHFRPLAPLAEFLSQ